MKARFEYFCKPAKKNAGYDAENIHLIVEIPYPLAVGTMVKLTTDGDYIEVDNVYLDLSTDEGITMSIGLKEPEQAHEWRPWPEMKKQGWRIG